MFSYYKAKTYISRTHHTTNLFHRVQVGTQTTVHGEDLLIDDGGNGQAVEAVGESLPKLDVIPPFALIVETVDSVNRSTLVVATKDEEVFGVFDLVCEEKADSLQRLLATVDVVSEEKVVGLWREATVFEKTQKVVVLAVNITANLNTSLATLRAIRGSGAGGGGDECTLMGASNSSKIG